MKNIIAIFALLAGLMSPAIAGEKTALAKTPAPAVKKILQNVPFTSQAPLGQWSDPRQQDGCEEASSLMAVKWARGQNLTKKEALKEITGLSDWLLKKYGQSRDTSAADTVDWIIKDYFGYQNAALVKNTTAAGIINELKKGRIVIAPMNGQLLNNPYYTPPGPRHHMVVIVGYDFIKKVFITNDGGTKRGKLYEYKTDVLFKAIDDYPTGNHKIDAKIEKNIIVVGKK